jgi:curved DNA-binding protein CbpA
MPGNGRLRMSTEEALDILGLEPTASAQEIRDAYCRLEQKVDPELGGTHYLMAKIVEARDVLLRE